MSFVLNRKTVLALVAAVVVGQSIAVAIGFATHGVDGIVPALVGGLVGVAFAG